MGSAFQQTAFQFGAFQIAPGGDVTDTNHLQLPVDCVLAGDQPYNDRGREYDIRPMNATEKTWGKHSSVRALGGGRPSFTTTTGKRGYD